MYDAATATYSRRRRYRRVPASKWRQRRRMSFAMHYIIIFIADEGGIARASARPGALLIERDKRASVAVNSAASSQYFIMLAIHMSMSAPLMRRTYRDAFSRPAYVVQSGISHSKPLRCRPGHDAIAAAELMPPQIVHLISRSSTLASARNPRHEKRAARRGDAAAKRLWPIIARGRHAANAAMR